MIATFNGIVPATVEMVVKASNGIIDEYEQFIYIPAEYWNSFIVLMKYYKFL